MFEILVVGCDDAVSTIFHKTVKDGFSHSSAYLGFCTAAELINQEQRMRPGIFHHGLHTEQMTAVSGEFVFKVLLIANADENILENTHYGIFAHRYGHTAL